MKIETYSQSKQTLVALNLFIKSLANSDYNRGTVPPLSEKWHIVRKCSEMGYCVWSPTILTSQASW